MNPKVVSDPNKYSPKFDATETFKDDLVDLRSVPRNFWAGKANKEVHFVYDLGCEASVTEVHLRNSHGGKSKGKGYFRLACYVTVVFLGSPKLLKY